MKTIKPIVLVIALFGILASSISMAWAHGEKSLEPFIRMRTIQWYDVAWSTAGVAVNDALTVTGRFHVAEDWPSSVRRPDMAYLGVIAPGPVFVRKQRYINGEPHLNSLPLQLGRDYVFKMVLKARIPGRYHIHPSFNVKDTGNVTGPGKWIEVTGDAEAFTNVVKTVTGDTIDMETYGVANGVRWHMLWMVLGLAWLVWWLRRPLFLPRYAKLKAGAEDELVTKTDRTIGKAILIVVPLIVLGGFIYTQSKYPHTIPLQASLDQIEPLPLAPAPVKAKIERATYRVIGRALTMNLQVVNEGKDPVQLAEFVTGSVRFLNPAAGVEYGDYPEEYVAVSGLQVGSDSMIEPGESRSIEVVAADAAWENQRLASVIQDADSHFGGLLFFYDDRGQRFKASISGPVIPDFS